MIDKEDYEEPICPLCDPNKAASIPIGRVTDKLDGYLAARDFAAAARHLDYWLTEASALRDARGRLSLLNEAVGFYRKQGDEQRSLAFVRQALEQADALRLNDSVTMGTTLINAATAYMAFGRTAQAIPLYERAKTIYEQHLSADDDRLGGLYNNMALALCDSGEYARAQAMFEQALRIMTAIEDAQPEVAVTYCNLADLAWAQQGENSAHIRPYLEKALAALDACARRDSDYGYVCEKCAPVFADYGWEDAARDLTARAEKAYERNGAGAFIL